MSVDVREDGLVLPLVPSPSVASSETRTGTGTAPSATTVLHNPTRKPPALHDLGNACFGKGEFQNAIIYYSRAIAARPNDPRLYANRSASFCGDLQYARALRDAFKAIELSPAWAKAYYRAGVAFFRLGQLVEALDLLETAAGLSPWDAAVQGACFDIRVRLKLMPVGAIPEIGKAYLRPKTATSMAQLGAGWLYAWGGAGVGALGLGDTDNQVYPKCIDSFRGKMLADFDCGYMHVVATTDSGEAYAWGSNVHFQCGMGQDHPYVRKPVPLPVRIPGLVGHVVRHIACGAAHTIVLTENRDVFTWGSGEDGQLGVGDTQPRVSPTHIPTFRPPTAADDGRPVARGLACGVSHTVVVCEGGVCFGFGRNDAGQLGLQAVSRREKTKRFTRPKRMFIGRVDMVVPQDSVVSAMARLAGASASKSYLPEPTWLPADVVQVACGAEHTVAVTSKGELYTVGSNAYGQLGYGRRRTAAWRAAHPKGKPRRAGGKGTPDAKDASDSEDEAGWEEDIPRAADMTPEQVRKCMDPRVNRDLVALLPGTVAFRYVSKCPAAIVMAACGDHFTAALSHMREVYTFGRGDGGQMGHGSLHNEHKPKLVSGMLNRATEYIACRSEQVVAVSRSGQMFWWGTGLRYRQDKHTLDGVKKEVLDARLAFAANIPKDRPFYMVRVEDREAPRFKQRVADFFRKRGIYAEDKEGGGGAGAAPARKPRHFRKAVTKVVEAVAEEKEAVAKTFKPPPKGPQLLDMAMGTVALVPMETTVPKDTRMVRVKCGEDFYVALAEGTLAEFSEVFKLRVDSDKDIIHQQALKKFAFLKEQMKDMYTANIANVMEKGDAADRKLAQKREGGASAAEGSQARLQQLQDAAAAKVEEAEEAAAAVDVGGLDNVTAARHYTGWKSIIQGIADSLVISYEVDPEEEAQKQREEKAAATAAAKVAAAKKAEAGGGDDGGGEDEAAAAAAAAATVAEEAKAAEEKEKAVVAAARRAKLRGTGIPRSVGVITMDAGNVLRMKIRTRNQAGELRSRGDDRLCIYLLHDIEDEIVFVDVEDHFNGTVTCSCRVRRAGTYKLHVKLRQAHLQGSPFTVVVNKLPPWPPASEFFPVSSDGIRSDVRIELHEVPAETLSGWGVPNLGNASRSKEMFIAGAEAGPVGHVYRVPRVVVIPYPDLKQALSRLERDTFNAKLSPTKTRRRRPSLPKEVLMPDGSTVDPKPVFLWFGKTFHRRDTVFLGNNTRMGFVLRDKCGNKITDPEWYDRVRCDVHRLVGSDWYGIHMATVRVQHRTAVPLPGSLDAVLEAVELNSKGHFVQLSLERSTVPGAGSMYREFAEVLAEARSRAAESLATRGTVSASPRAHLPARSPRDVLKQHSSWLTLQRMTDSGMVLEESTALAGSMAAPSSDYPMLVDTGGGYDPTPRTELMSPAARGSLYAPSSSVPDTILALGGGDSLVSPMAGSLASPMAGSLASPLAAGLAVGPSLASLATFASDGGGADWLAGDSVDSLLDGAGVLPPDAVAEGASPSVLPAMSADVPVAVSEAPPAQPWDLDLVAAAAMHEDYVIDGLFGEVGDHTVSFTLGPAPPKPTRRRKTAKGRADNAEAAADTARTGDTGVSGTTGVSGDTSGTMVSGSGGGSQVLAGSVAGGGSSSMAGGNSMAGSLAGDSCSLVPPAHLKSSPTAAGRLSPASTLRSEGASSATSASGVGPVDADVDGADLPLNYNTAHRRDEFYRAAPDDYMGLPALYDVQPGVAVGSTSVVHYLDPMLVDLPRVPLGLPPQLLDKHLEMVAEATRPRPRTFLIPVPDAFSDVVYVGAGRYTCVGVTLCDVYGNPSKYGARVTAVATGPGTMSTTCVSVDLADKTKNADMGHVVSRRAVVQARNKALADHKKFPDVAAVDCHQWAVCFASFKAGDYELRIFQDGVEVIGSPVHVQVVPGACEHVQCYGTGAGWTPGAPAHVPAAIHSHHDALAHVTDFPVIVVPDRPEAVVVTCDRYGNPLLFGGQEVTALVERWRWPTINKKRRAIARKERERAAEQARLDAEEAEREARRAFMKGRAPPKPPTPPPAEEEEEEAAPKASKHAHLFEGLEDVLNSDPSSESEVEDGEVDLAEVLMSDTSTENETVEVTATESEEEGVGGEGVGGGDVAAAGAGGDVLLEAEELLGDGSVLEEAEELLGGARRRLSAAVPSSAPVVPPLPGGVGAAVAPPAVPVGTPRDTPIQSVRKRTKWVRRPRVVQWVDEGQMGNLKVEDYGTGRYGVHYTIRHSGRYRLSIWLNGRPLPASPMLFLGVDMEVPPPPKPREGSPEPDTDSDAVESLLGSDGGGGDAPPEGLTGDSTFEEPPPDPSDMQAVVHLLVLEKRKEKARLKAAEEERARLEALEAQRLIEEEAFYAGVANYLVDNRQWVLDCDAERVYLEECLRTERHALADRASKAADAHEHRFRLTEKWDAKKRVALRAQEARLAADNEAARVLYAREQQRVRAIQYLLTQEDDHKGDRDAAVRELRLKRAEQLLTATLLDTDRRYLGAGFWGKYAEGGDAMGEAGLLDPAEADRLAEEAFARLGKVVPGTLAPDAKITGSGGEPTLALGGQGRAIMEKKQFRNDADPF